MSVRACIDELAMPGGGAVLVAVRPTSATEATVTLLARDGSRGPVLGTVREGEAGWTATPVVGNPTTALATRWAAEAALTTIPTQRKGEAR